MASSPAAVCAAPADYGKLYLEYGDEIRRMVRRHLGPAAQSGDVDDGVQYILGQFIKNDVIGQYEPGYINDYNHKPTTFRAFMLAKVPLYCKGLRESLYRRQGRELQVLTGDEGTDYDLDVIGAVTDSYPSLAGGGMDLLRERLAGSAADGEPVLPLFEALAARFEQGQSVSAAAVRRQFGKTREEADAWFESLKAALRDDPQSPPEPESPGPEKSAAWFGSLCTADGGYLLGGLVLSAYEVRAAADALKMTNGNQVLRAFREFSHRLAGSGKTWYLVFAEQVMRAHPELRNPPMRHRDGHFGRVKRALIYGLEELAGDVPEVLPGPPEPAPVTEAVVLPVTEPVAAPAQPADPESAALWAELESVISRLPGYGSENVEAAVQAVRLLSLAPA